MMLEPNNLKQIAAKARMSQNPKFEATVINFADYERRTISSCLPKGKTMEDAILRAKTFREQIWTRRIPEDRKITTLLAMCTALMNGNVTAGQLLASAAIWEPS